MFAPSTSMWWSTWTCSLWNPMVWIFPEWGCGTWTTGPNTIGRPWCSAPCRTLRSTTSSQSTVPTTEDRYATLHLTRHTSSWDFRKTWNCSSTHWPSTYRVKTWSLCQGFFFVFLRKKASSLSFNIYLFQIVTKNMPKAGSICQVLVQLPHVFQMFSSDSFMDHDSR